ncbi:SusC/RagA family TonB-linked outer membrane protein [Carboxylicivirga taeanensis]|uniref:SusC/RagA family TonB-linked outer membrane protein n=1 Tax=Carboxylicivirga taeanensis TaxID=1416875 RepID=UPI003F6DB2A3
MKKNPIIGLVIRCITRPGGRLLSVLFLSVMILNGMQLFAQERISIQGEVIDVSGETLPGVNVSVKGTSNGTITDITGKFSLSVLKNEVLVVSFVGYKAQEIPIGEQVNFRIVLEEDVLDLDEVVVTALGIKREKKALGYSVTEVNAEDIARNGEMNAMASLAGKVAGVDITQTSAGPSGSKRVVIRGISELEGSNQPLYVIDGVPVDNSTRGQATEWGGFDLGDGTSDLNSEDIESISVLKGASASALYGSRALNGVILITTKSGTKGRKGLGVEINSSATIDQVSTKLDDYQTVYGQGNNGLLPREGQPANSATTAWGPKLDPSIMLRQQDGNEYPYARVDENVQGFFRLGKTFNNSVALSAGGEKGSVRFSYTNVHNEDIIPKSGLNRNTFNLRALTEINSFMELDAKATYIADKVNNRPAMTDEVTNIGNGLVGLAPNFDQAWLQTYTDEDGNYIDYTGNDYRANPYWTLNETFNQSRKNRFVGFASLNVSLTKDLKLRLKSGIDRYSSRFVNFYDKNTPTKAGGVYNEINTDAQEINYEALLSYTKTLGDWDLSANVGGNIMQNNIKTNNIAGSNIIEPGIASIINFTNVEVLPSEYRKEIQSIYAFAQFGYKNFAFIDITGRNDWSSTLPSNNNSYFYPSVSGSFIFTDAADLNLPWLTYGKLRASYAQVGSDTDPYRLALTYALTGKSYNGMPTGEIMGDFVPNSDLLSQTTTSWEVGTDLRFLNNALGLDFTYYEQTTDDQILNVELPVVSGYKNAILNSGSLENKGIELQLTARPFKGNFSWDIVVNYTKVWNKVVSLHEDVDAYTIANARWSGVTVVALAGEEFGTIMGNAYVRDPEGNVVHDASTGMPLVSDAPQKIGSILPDWTGGMINTFSYKNFTLKANLDIRIGGDIYSITNRQMVDGGTHAITESGREGFNDWAKRNDDARNEWIGGGNNPDDYVPLEFDNGFVGQGVKMVVDDAGNVTYEKNDVITNPQSYWRHTSANIPESNVYDASYIKIRDLSLGYSVPKQFLKNTPIQGLTLTVVGRNLFTLHKNVPNIDPESTYNNGNGQGLEYGSLPTRRHYGFNLNIKF